MNRFFIQIITFIALSFPVIGIVYNETHAQPLEIDTKTLFEQDFLLAEEKTEPYHEYRSVTRGEFLRWIINNSHFDHQEYNDVETPFIDIARDEEIYSYVSSGYMLGGLSQFESDKKFLPNKKLTRLEAVTMLMNIEGISILNNYDSIISNTWKDLPTDSKERHIALIALEKGYLKSTPDGFIFPDKRISKKEALLMLDTYNTSKNQTEYTIHINSEIQNNQINTVESLIYNEYWKSDEIEKNQLEDAAITGVVNYLEDPYSVYFPPEESQKFENYINEETEFEEKEYAGLGVVVQEANEGGMVIMQVFSGSPAEISDIRSGDIVIKIEGKDVTSIPLDEITNQIKGEVGTSQNITIQRGSTTLEKTFIREKIFVENLSSVETTVENNIVWIRVRAFKKFTSNDFQKALQENVTENTKGVIVDLRYNSGGLLSAAQEMLGEFLEEGSIAVRLYSKDTEDIFYTNGSGEYIEIPIVVFQNEYSASASEIFSASIKDYERGVIIGKKSYGKGVAQTLFPLERGSIKLTTAEFKSPLQNIIHHIGVEPNIEIMNQDDASYFYEARKILR